MNSIYNNILKYIINNANQLDKILVDFEPYTETGNVVTRKCYRCKQVKDIDCFKRVYIISKKHYNNCAVRYTLACSECLDTGRDTYLKK